MPRLMSLVLCATVLLAAVRPAAADTKKACADAYEASQEQRSSGKLKAARDSLVACSQSTCPGFIKKDCAKWLSEVEAAIPTVVFSAKLGAEQLTDVKVTLGDEVLATSLDGKAVPMDPGTHAFVFESAKHGKIERKLVVKEGAKAQQVEASFVPPNLDEGAPKKDQGSATVGTEQVKSGKTLAYVLMGVGVVGLGGFAYFGLSGNGDKGELECADSKTCTDEDLDPIEKKYLYADIALGVGLVSLGVGTYLLLAPSKKSEAAAEQAKRLHVDVAARPGGGFATLFGRF